MENLVKLIPREHYICHLLLPKTTENLFRRKMVYALWCIINLENGNQNRYKITSRQYDLIKNKQSIARKLYKHTSKSCRKISKGNKGKRVSEETKKYNGLNGVANSVRKQWYGWTCQKV